MLDSMESLTRTTAVALNRGTVRESRPDRAGTIDRLSAIVHDLRNPLAAICGCAEMLIEADLEPVQARRVAVNIHRAAGRMRELLAELAQSTQEHAEAAERCNLRALVWAACETAGVTDRENLDLLLDIPPQIELVLVRNRMERVILNLVVNAMEAMPAGGKIRITAREAAGSVRIEVEDNGPGIPREIRSLLFEPFVTYGKKGGLGLGLALSRQAVRDHGGELWVEPAAGARFVVSLPAPTVQPLSHRPHPINLRRWDEGTPSAINIGGIKNGCGA